MKIKKRTLLKAAAALMFVGSSVAAHAEDVVKVGLIVPMSGPSSRPIPPMTTMNMTNAKVTIWLRPVENKRLTEL